MSEEWAGALSDSDFESNEASYEEEALLQATIMCNTKMCK